MFADGSVLLWDCHKVTIHYEWISNKWSGSHCEYWMALNLWYDVVSVQYDVKAFHISTNSTKRQGTICFSNTTQQRTFFSINQAIHHLQVHKQVFYWLFLDVMQRVLLQCAMDMNSILKAFSDWSMIYHHKWYWNHQTNCPMADSYNNVDIWWHD